MHLYGILSELKDERLGGEVVNTAICDYLNKLDTTYRVERRNGLTIRVRVVKYRITPNLVCENVAICIVGANIAVLALYYHDTRIECKIMDRIDDSYALLEGNIWAAIDSINGCNDVATFAYFLPKGIKSARDGRVIN